MFVIMQNTGSLTVFMLSMNEHIIQNGLFSVNKHLPSIRRLDEFMTFMLYYS